MRSTGVSRRRAVQSSWFSVSIKNISHYIETNSRLELNDIESSDPRLGSLLVLSTVVLPTAHSISIDESTTHRNRSGSCESWSEVTPDLRPGDLVVIKNIHMGERFVKSCPHNLILELSWVLF